ncbi:GNAT family acetyltransferase [Clostridium botulinum CFSAN001627]|uniref:GNAT family acetyltransferase n=1 Tax=Clostridium botulinum CFSAN001627 TaxID=1232189 RepID=M1ZYU3_CLOBO|nr:GNAT family acetyltransferase [Clostridium botulinum CFSAN001627]
MGKIKQAKYNINGKTIIIRHAEVQDADQLINFIKKVNQETDFLLKDPEEVCLTIKEEKEFIQSQIDSQVDLLIVPEVDGKIVGVCSLNGNTNKRIRHSAQFGLAVEKEYCGMGIGKNLMKSGIQWAKENGIFRITLEVDINNYRAISLYLKFGFEIEGTLRNDKMLSDGSYTSGYAMALLL